jgi:hypothetical protein
LEQLIELFGIRGSTRYRRLRDERHAEDESGESRDDGSGCSHEVLRSPAEARRRMRAII